MLNIFSRKGDESSKIEATENDIMNAIQSKMSKPVSEDDLSGNLLAQKLNKLTFKINLQTKNEIDNMMLKYFKISYNSGKQPVQAHQFNVFSNQLSPPAGTPPTPTPSCTNNTAAVNFPARPEFANNRINFLHLQTQDPQSKYAVGNSFLQYMESKQVNEMGQTYFLKLHCICTSFFHTNRQTVTVKLCLYFLYVPIAKIRTFSMLFT